MWIKLLLAADYEVVKVLMTTSLSCKEKKNFKYLKVRGHRILKPRSKFI